MSSWLFGFWLFRLRTSKERLNILAKKHNDYSESRDHLEEKENSSPAVLLGKETKGKTRNDGAHCWRKSQLVLQFISIVLYEKIPLAAKATIACEVPLRCEGADSLAATLVKQGKSRNGCRQGKSYSRQRWRSDRTRHSREWSPV